MCFFVKYVCCEVSDNPIGEPQLWLQLADTSFAVDMTCDRPMKQELLASSSTAKMRIRKLTGLRVVFDYCERSYVMFFEGRSYLPFPLLNLSVDATRRYFSKWESTISVFSLPKRAVPVNSAVFFSSSYYFHLFENIVSFAYFMN